MKLTLAQGRPETNDERLEKEIRTYDLLDKLGIPYERVDHEAADTWRRAWQLMKFSLRRLFARTSFCATRRKQSFIC